MWASCLGYYDIVRLLVEAGAELKTSGDEHGWSAISLAARRNHYKIVKYLTGIDNSIVEVIDERRYNLLHIAVDLNDKTQLATTLASLANSLLTFCEKAKLDFKTKFLEAMNRDGMTPLHIAASKGLLFHVKLLFLLGSGIETPAKCDIYPGEKATALFFAAIYGHEYVVQYLLSKGARFNEYVRMKTQVGRKGYKVINPFREAAYRGHADVLMALLQHPQIVRHDPMRPLLTEKSFHRQQFKNFESVRIWFKTIVAGIKHEGHTVTIEEQFIDMIKSVNASREAQMLFDCFISKYKAEESPYTMVSPYGKPKFSNKWNMFKGEYITAGSEDFDPDSSESELPSFWAKRANEPWSRIWNGFFKGAVESHCVSYTINIPYTSHRSFLELFLLIDREADTEIPRTEDSKGAYSIFDIDFVEASVLHAWNSYGVGIHIRDLIMYLGYLVLSSYTNYTFNAITPDDDSTFKRAGIVLVKIELALTAFFAYRWLFIHFPKITKTLNSKHAHLFRYIMNVGIWVEISWLGWYSLTFAGSVIRLRRGVETDLSSYLIAIATMLQYMLVVTYFRPFKAFGPLIGMIEAIIWDIRYYILILGVVLYGFSQALYLTAWQNPDDGSTVLFGTPAGALAQSIVYLVGNPQYPPGWTSDSAVSTFLAIMLTVVGSIIMLNLLIAIMNNTYSRIKLHDESEWLKQLCITITEQRFLWPTQPDKFVHYLRRKIDVDREKLMM